MTERLPRPPESSPASPAPRRRPASLARRIAPAVAVLGIGGGLFVLLDEPRTAPPVDTDDGDEVVSGPTTTTGAATTTTSTAGAGTEACDGRTITGAPVPTRYGDVQVQVTFTASGEVCDVTPLQWPDDLRSAPINDRALPILEDQAIEADGSSLDGVSGATYTSDAYAASLQSAIDELS